MRPNDIHKIIIYVEIPYKDRDPELFDIISSQMIHSPCGQQNKNSSCMQNNICIEHFLKKIVDNIVID